MHTTTHEDFSREQEIKGPSDRSFGVTFAAVFTLIGLWPLLRGADPRSWAFTVAGTFLLLALALPRVLGPLNRLWLSFGLLLHRVVSPVILAVLFFGVVTPTGLIMRALGKRPLALDLDPDAESYWVPRDPPGPPPESMRNQF